MRRLIGILVLGLAAGVASSPAAAPAAAPKPAPKVDARTVLITGANRGLGLEFSRQYHAAGWKVIGTARKPDEAADLKALGEGVRILPLDVTQAASVAALVAALRKEPIDLLINNAGQGVGGGPLADLTMEKYEQVMQVNALGPVRVTQALLPNLRAGKGKTIVGISSGLGSIGLNENGGFYGYRESKAALDMYMRSLAADLRDEGFVCIAMIPGWVKTDMGGPNAPLAPEQSVTGMRKVIAGLKPADSGKFWSHDGSIVPW